MKFSYKDNRTWQRFTLKIYPQQVTSHCVQICYLWSMRTTAMSAFFERHYFFVCFRSRGDDMWPRLQEGSEKFIV